MESMETQQQRATRYFWQPVEGPETSYSLVDRVSAKSIAVVTYMNSARKWRWSRNTSPLLHGAGSSCGITKLLADAKAAVLADLPDEM